MRVAVSGSHAVGKTTLVDELRVIAPQHAYVDEAYVDLLNEGHVFAAAPAIEDIAAQLARSISVISSRSDPNIVFERCPVDYLAYLVALGADSDTVAWWIRESHCAISILDGIIFVPVEDPDRINVSADELPRLRKKVNGILQAILVEDEWALGCRVTEVTGSPTARVNQAASWIGGIVDGADLPGMSRRNQSGLTGG